MNIARQLSWDTFNTTTLLQTIRETLKDKTMKR